MIDLAIIPARGGSVGLPGKNIIDLGGQPLIAWTVKAALASGEFARIIVSTDDDAIADAARDAGAEVPFRRPASLATSTTSSLDMVLHTLETLVVEGDFALLQPTSPFRTADHLREAAEEYGKQQAVSLISVCEGKPLSWIFYMDEAQVLGPAMRNASIATRRQDEQKTFIPNGAIYISQTEYFYTKRAFITAESIGYKMSQMDSLDIDDMEDYEFARAIIDAGIRKP